MCCCPVEYWKKWKGKHVSLIDWWHGVRIIWGNTMHACSLWQNPPNLYLHVNLGLRSKVARYLLALDI
jgi:hypothetical protein